MPLKRLFFRISCNKETLLYNVATRNNCLLRTCRLGNTASHCVDVCFCIIMTCRPPKKPQNSHKKQNKKTQNKPKSKNKTKTS